MKFKIGMTVIGRRKEMRKRIYYRFGKEYQKLNCNEVIKEGAMQSWCHGELQPITNSDGETIGSTPAEFSEERDFYNALENA